MVGHWRERVTGKRETGLLAAVSYASRENVPPEGLKYVRRYWYAVAVLAILVLAGTAARLGALRAAFA